MDTSRLNTVNFGLALGITWGAWLGLLALVARLTGWAYQVPLLLGKLYPGYAPTFKGTVIGGLWGLVCGFICGAVFVWIYNQLQTRAKSGG
ncbi:MAG: hypothetical protein RL477_1940 [Pseudomonadota bacterium]|jgi:hypothetical protein